MSDLAQLDGQPAATVVGETILQYAERHRGRGVIPTLCHAPRLRPHGACRVCVVEVARSPDGPRKFLAACHTPMQAGWHVFTESPAVTRLRRNIVELLLTDHPRDCLTCPGNGACELQALAARVGVRAVRYPAGANHLATPVDASHPYLRADLARCIACYRCVRACDEVQGQFVLSVHGRGFDSRISIGRDTTFAESPCVSCGACVQTCPTGAITDRYGAKTPQATRRVRTTCAYCGVGCQLEVAARGDEVLGVRAPWDAAVNAGHTCVKGRYAFEFYRHPDRLRQPLLRRDGKLEPVSWETAYDFLTSRLHELRQAHGPNSIAGIASARCTNEENFLFQKFLRVVIGTNNVDCCARVCHGPTAYGMQQAFGTGAATNSIADLEQTDLVLVVGANPTVAHPVTGAKIKQVALKGTPLIVVDPVQTELARIATWHLQLRPGTNLALLNLMAYYILEAGLANADFVARRTEGFDEFAAALRGLDPAAQAAICGVDAATVRAAALAYAQAPRAMAFHGLGVTEFTQGSRAVMAIANLALMCGHLGRPGVGMNPLRGQNNVQGAADMGCQPNQGAGYLDVTNADNRAHYERHYGRPVPAQVGLKIPEMLTAAAQGELKALWVIGEDLVQTEPDSDHTVAALAKLELLVVQDLFLSETGKRAHVVLPAASFLEKSGTFTNGERRIQRVQAAVPPLRGSRPDGQIVVDVMNRFGYAQPSYDAAQTLAEVARVVPFFAGVIWERLGDNGLQWPVDATGRGTPILHTASFKRGRGKFHFNAFEETPELTAHAGAEFPFILTTGRILQHYNSGTMTRRTPNRELVDRDLLLVHPDDAAARGVRDGGAVRLTSVRGAVVLTARLTRQVKPGVLFTSFHFPELQVNCITSDQQDRETRCPEYKVVAAQIAPA